MYVDHACLQLVFCVDSKMSWFTYSYQDLRKNTNYLNFVFLHYFFFLFWHFSSCCFVYTCKHSKRAIVRLSIVFIFVFAKSILCFLFELMTCHNNEWLLTRYSQNSVSALFICLFIYLWSCFFLITWQTFSLLWLIHNFDQ